MTRPDTEDLTPEDIRADMAVLADVLPKLTVTMDQLAKRLGASKSLSPVDRVDAAGTVTAVAGVLRKASFVAAVAAKNI